MRQEYEEERLKSLEKRITSPKKKTQKKDLSQIIRIYIRKIEIQGVKTTLPLSDIASSFEGRDFSFQDLRKISEAITQRLYTKGFSNLKAELPPQTIKDGILKIEIVEETED